MNKGFTIIEFLVVIFIVATLSAILITNFPRGDQRFALQRTAHKIIQDLRKAQEMSMSAREEICPSSEKANGFGVYFDQSSPYSYFIFANCDGNYGYEATNDEILENINLEEGTKILGLSSSPLSVTFVPPSTVTYINNIPGYINNIPTVSAQIVISLANIEIGGGSETDIDTSKMRIIQVNGAGLIEIVE